MKLLLDTHTVCGGSRTTSGCHKTPKPRSPIPQTSCLRVLLSGTRSFTSSAWVDCPRCPESLPRRLLKEGIEMLPITLDHALRAAALPGPHRDPWDRIMMAQALAEQCRMATVDQVFSDYDIPVLW